MQPSQRGFYVLATIPRFGCKVWSDNARAYSQYAFSSVEMLEDLYASKRSWRNNVISVKLFSTSFRSAVRGRNALIEMFNPKNYQFGEIQTEYYESIEVELAHLESTFDRTYMMSDDHSAWSSGERKLNRINALRKHLGMVNYYTEHPLHLFR